MSNRLPVRRPYERYTRNVRNQSDRAAGVPIEAVVIHVTVSHPRPGTGDLLAIVNYFDNPSSQASSHVVIDDSGVSARCVPDTKKAWTCARYNSSTLNIELVAMVESRAYWQAHEDQVKKCAKYLAYWNKRHGIPLQMAQPKGLVNGVGRFSRKGVIGHMHLGANGGNHSDPGKGFDFERLIRAARYYRSQGWPH